MKRSDHRRQGSARRRERTEPATTAPALRTPPFPVVGVGASAGGMEAFIELLKHVPGKTGVAFVLIQHLDRSHESHLAEAIARSTGFPVGEIEDGVRVQPDHVYVIPPDRDVAIVEGALALLPRPDSRRPHLAVDFFFKTLAADRAGQAIGVVLSGTGSDGREGLRAIKAEGGITFAQDPESAKFRGMPEAAVKAGAVDIVLPISAIAHELVRLAGHPFFAARGRDVSDEPSDEGELKKVLLLVRSATGVDFNEYKVTTIRRRLARRMALRRQGTVADYLRLLRDDPTEARAFSRDVLIHVTSFFRGKEAFERIRETVFPQILKARKDDAAIRVWAAGCSTGQEAYSIAIALLEFLVAENAASVPIQIFGTDISDEAIDTARAGLYPESIAEEVGKERLAAFFTRVEGGYRINRSVRERCAFVRHDLANDPPYSKLDLVSCRNVLIYFGRELQKRVLATLHFGLNVPGFLLLGQAENISEGSGLFSVVDKQAKIFSRSAARSALQLGPRRELRPLLSHATAPPAPAQHDFARRMESAALERYAPPGVVINERMEILQFQGRTGLYLEPPTGQPLLDVLKMARKGLSSELGIVISQARKANTTVRREGVRIDQDGVARTCNLTVVPLGGPAGPAERLFAIFFEAASASDVPEPRRTKKGRAASRASKVEQPAAWIAEELKATKEHLQSVLEQTQRASEENLSANEELISSNEELQSLNEELETAKEELQSTNEELSTLNEEMSSRNTELNLVNSDLLNILGSVEVPIVIVDAARCIRRFTPKARLVLNLLPGDVGRPIDDIRARIDVDNLDQRIAEVIDTVTMHESEVRDHDGRWFRLQIRPYLTVDKRIDGAVLSFMDIDVLKRALGSAEWTRDYANATVEAVPTPIIVLDRDLRVLSSNRSFRAGYGAAQNELVGRSFFELQNGAWDVSEVRAALGKVIEKDQPFERILVEPKLPRGGRRSVLLSGQSIPAATGTQMVLVAAEDVTDRLAAERGRARSLVEAQTATTAAEQANYAKDLFLATLSHELRTPLSVLLLQSHILKGPLDAAQLRRSAEVIEHATQAQAGLIDDLLDVSRILAGKLEFKLEPVSLASGVEAALEAVKVDAERKHLVIDAQIDRTLAPVSGDPARLEQIVANLLTNAVKFTPEGGRISVTVDAEGGAGRIRVRDTGRGIDSAFLPHLFDRFSQEDRTRTRAHGGLGLGLAIVRHLVDAHGGTIAVESAGRDRGSTFTVRLPFARRAEKPIEATRLEAPSTGATVQNIDKARILIVEDDAATRASLTQVLSVRGAEVRSAASAAEAMTVFREFRPEIMVCDVAMPGEDGYSLLTRIRALGPGQGSDVRAVALTALAGAEDRRLAAAAGFQVHLAKPVEADRLVAALAALRAA